MYLADVYNILNLTCVAADTEYNLTYGTSLIFFKVKARGGTIKWKKITGGPYISIADGTSEDFHAVGFVEKFYYESPTAGAVAEVVLMPLVP